VGYFVGFIAPGLHYKTCLTCTSDIYWLDPQIRGSGSGREMFEFVESELRHRGVSRFFVGTKCHKDIGWLLSKLGYTDVEHYYSRWLGGS
jgi:N-acetylglutamate synthase-like GNAT family acetyltransferase